MRLLRAFTKQPGAPISINSSATGTEFVVVYPFALES